MSEKMVENCKIVCSNRYRLSDGTYECTVCISVPSRSAELVAGAASLSEDERIGIKFREEQFRESFKEELERFRQMQSGK